MSAPSHFRLPALLCGVFLTLTAVSAPGSPADGTPWVTDLTCRSYPPVDSRNTPDQDDLTAAPIRSGREAVDYKLKSILISSDFSGLSLQQATDRLHAESVRRDEPSHQGISFSIAPAALRSAKPIVTSFENVTAAEVLRLICREANVEYKVQTNGISIAPRASHAELNK